MQPPSVADRFKTQVSHAPQPSDASDDVRLPWARGSPEAESPRPVRSASLTSDSLLKLTLRHAVAAWATCTENDPAAPSTLAEQFQQTQRYVWIRPPTTTNGRLGIEQRRVCRTHEQE